MSLYFTKTHRSLHPTDSWPLLQLLPHPLPSSFGSQTSRHALQVHTQFSHSELDGKIPGLAVAGWQQTPFFCLCPCLSWVCCHLCCFFPDIRGALDSYPHYNKIKSALCLPHLESPSETNQTMVLIDSSCSHHSLSSDLSFEALNFVPLEICKPYLCLESRYGGCTTSVIIRWSTDLLTLPAMNLISGLCGGAYYLLSGD